MSPTPHGLVIGKFYPPHEGHHLLIDTAAACSTRLTVLVLSHEVESIPHRDRVAWLREIHAHQPHVTFMGVIDDHPVDFADPVIWDLHEAVFRAGIASVTAEPVTAVFSSEEYGPELARRLGAVAVPVDDDRGLAPVSGTAVRADPIAHWSRLAPPVRGWFARRVVVLGAESTGTTTVSHALVDALRARGGAHGLTQWVPEHCRTMAVAKLAADRAAAVLDGATPPEMAELTWRADEFLRMAERQNELEDAAARAGGPVLVCDTDAFAVAVWHERYCGAADAAVEAQARRHPLYLLTDHTDVPFEQDGFRDGEAIRPWMTDRFDEVLRESGRHFVILRGPRDERVAAGLAAIDALLVAGWGLADPLSPATPPVS